MNIWTKKLFEWFDNNRYEPKTSAACADQLFEEQKSCMKHRVSLSITLILALCTYTTCICRIFEHTIAQHTIARVFPALSKTSATLHIWKPLQPRLSLQYIGNASERCAVNGDQSWSRSIWKILIKICSHHWLSITCKYVLKALTPTYTIRAIVIIN